jgi:hypothetical protein
MISELALQLLNKAHALNSKAEVLIKQRKRLKPLLLLVASALIAYPILGLSIIMLRLGFK